MFFSSHHLYFWQFPCFLQVCFGLWISSNVWWSLVAPHLEGRALNSWLESLCQWVGLLNKWASLQSNLVGLFHWETSPTISTYRSSAQIDQILQRSIFQFHPWRIHICQNLGRSRSTLRVSHCLVSFSLNPPTSVCALVSPTWEFSTSHSPRNNPAGEWGGIWDLSSI